MSVRNAGKKPVTLEMLSSFSLGGMTPYAHDDAPNRLAVHRYRSTWSAEGRLNTQDIEDLQLERSWIGHGIACERFGQVGSMPVRRFFPFVALEDREAGVLWGAQLATPGSWQMEVFRKDDFVALSGGQADREFGHWFKTLKAGETYDTPAATIGCIKGNIDELAQRLSSAQEGPLANLPKIENELPIVVNEWCTSWGNPSQEDLLALAQRIKGTPAKYLVIDAGWYQAEGTSWSSGHGDWEVSKRLFPNGLAAAAQAIRECGLIPGLWFEMETLGIHSARAAQDDALLRRDGQVLDAGRRFWDFRDPRTFDYLTKKAIDLLRNNGFGYLKVDYNETIGFGVDGAESPGEGLRQHLEGMQKFFRKMREEIPDLVIENCSSGGHRLEPSMMGLCAMGSFSDAHETREISIIAANLQRLILPRQSQIWAVRRKNDTAQRPPTLSPPPSSAACAFRARSTTSQLHNGSSAFPPWNSTAASIQSSATATPPSTARPAKAGATHKAGRPCCALRKMASAPCSSPTPLAKHFQSPCKSHSPKADGKSIRTGPKKKACRQPSKAIPCNSTSAANSAPPLSASAARRSEASASGFGWCNLPLRNPGCRRQGMREQL